MSQSPIIGLAFILGLALIFLLVAVSISSRRNGRKTSGFRPSRQGSSADAATFVAVTGGFGGGGDCGPADGGGSCDGGGGGS